MAAKDLGTKYSCFKCQTKFYDLKKPIPTCPKCGADQRDAPTPKQLAAAARKAAKAAEAEETPELPDEDAELETDDDEAEEPADEE